MAPENSSKTSAAHFCITWKSCCRSRKKTFQFFLILKKPRHTFSALPPRVPAFAKLEKVARVPTNCVIFAAFSFPASLDRNDNFVREYNLTKLSSSLQHDVMIVPHRLSLLLKLNKKCRGTRKYVFSSTCHFHSSAPLSPFNACKTQQQISYLNLLTIYTRCEMETMFYNIVICYRDDFLLCAACKWKKISPETTWFN
jgi:hypothetical protein